MICNDKCIHQYFCKFKKIGEDCDYFQEERPQGKWVYGNLDHSTCSNCNYFNHYGDLPFCPNCGAEMANNGE